MRVLIVEDEVRLAELISRTLKRELIETAIAHDGREGLEGAMGGHTTSSSSTACCRSSTASMSSRNCGNSRYKRRC